MNCPICNIPLSIAERQGVEIDYCPQCRGIWLDRGELDKIIERMSISSESPARPYPERRDERYDRGHDRYDRHHDEHDHRHKKKRGFLGDLFDFD